MFTKIKDWIDRLRKGKMLTIVVSMFTIIIILALLLFYQGRQFQKMAENNYNQSFYELVEYVNNTEKLLAKSTITKDSSHATKILTSVWRMSTLAQNSLSKIPIEPEELENTQKFLNQVGDYSFSLSNKTSQMQDLSQDDIDHLSELHDYAISLENTLNQLETDLYSKNIKWGSLSNKGSKIISSETTNITKSSFDSIEEDLHQYTGLIYDGAFSESQQYFKGLGLTGDEISEEQAMLKAQEFIGTENIENLESENEVTNSNIDCYEFLFDLKNNSKATISITKKGGHILLMNNNRNTEEKKLTNEEAIKAGKDFLNKKQILNMKETYYMEEGNNLTVNYAYTQKDDTGNEVIIYPDLIKVKIAMDNGEILGIEAKNYLNSHQEKRDFEKVKISQDEAIKKINQNLQINGIDFAVIPTAWNTEIMCYEVKGKTNGNDFMVYINVATGREEDILMVVNTPNGTMVT